MTLQDWLMAAGIIMFSLPALESVRRDDHIDASARIIGLALIALVLLLICVGLESDVARERFLVRHLWAERDSVYRENQVLRDTLRGRTAR